MPADARPLLERRRVTWRIPKMIPKIAKGSVMSHGIRNHLVGPPPMANGETDRSPNDRLVIAKARDRFLVSVMVFVPGS